VGYRKMGKKDVEVGETTINQKEESTILDNFDMAASYSSIL
jgi:hypothetical protein